MVALAPDYYAPAFALYVETTELQDDITSDVVSVSFEHTVDMASKLSVVLANPDNRYTDSAVFEPGNEISLHLGYGPILEFVGRGELTRHVPTFPSGDTVPSIELIGYDRSWRLGQQEMEITGGASKKPQKAGIESGKLHVGTVGSVATKILGAYGITPDVSPLVAAKPVKANQKKGTTDLAFMRALANLNDAELVVEYEPNPAGIGGQWMGRLRPVEAAGLLQLKRYTFLYDRSDASTVLSCRVDFAIDQTASEVQAMVWNPILRDWVVLSTEEPLPGLPRKPTPGDFANPGGAMGAAMASPPPLEIESMTQLKLAVAGHSLRVVTRRFKDPAEALAWCHAYLKRLKEQMILVSFEVPGVAELRAGQTHALDGIGVRFSGDYYLSEVRHVWSDSGYICECKGHKVLK